MNLLKSENEKQLFEKALRLWGLSAQKGMVMEECGELLTALNRFNRNRATDNDVIDELADVIILIGQMSVVFGEEKLQFAIDQKMARLEYRIKNHEKL